MVRLSKQKQEKLENIMNLVEELGIDRVLARLRQTKMMSKEVLDEMKVFINMLILLRNYFFFMYAQAWAIFDNTKRY